MFYVEYYYDSNVSPSWLLITYALIDDEQALILIMQGIAEPAIEGQFPEVPHNVILKV